MSNSFTQHPDDGLLLRYTDGELTPGEARQVEKHLEACWQCRTEIEELKATVAECMRYRKNDLSAQLPPPPNPWPDLARGFAEIDAAEPAGSFLGRIFRPVAPLRWTLAAAAVLAVCFGLYYQLRETPAVEAAGLLKRAVAASAARPVHVVQRVRFRSRTQQFVRGASAPLPAAIEARFQAAHYDSTDPLSAHAFQAWRDSEPQKQDEVSTVADPVSRDGNCYRIHTIAAEGDVAAATLMLRVTDLVPVEGMLEFRDSQWIEFSEFTESPDRSTDANTASNVEPPERLAVPPSRLAVAPPRSSVSISDELQVLSALHQIGADLGDPIQVSLSSDKVLVSGIGVSPQQRQRIQRTLESMPNVAVQFTEPVAAPVLDGSAGSVPATSGNTRASEPAGKIQTRLEEQLGGPAEFERFSSQILDVDEGATSRAYALRSLARQFPVSSEGALRSADRRVLREIAREDAASLSATLQTLDHAIHPVLVSLGGTASPRSAPPAVNWQASAEDVVRHTQRVQVLVSVLFGLAPGQSSNQLPSDVLSAISELRSELDRCRQLLAQEGGG